MGHHEAHCNADHRLRVGCSACSCEAGREIKDMRRPWRAVDAQDWQYIASIIPDGGRGRFWKTVLAEMRVALETNLAAD